MEKDKPKTVSAEKYRIANSGRYVFPFTALDDIWKDGSSLGRIQWRIEPIKGRKTKGRYYYEKLLVSATQTRDPRYKGMIFEIPCYSESITGDSINRESFLNYVWRTLHCEIHNTTMLDAYPANHHTQLVINVSSSISIDIDFK